MKARIVTLAGLALALAASALALGPRPGHGAQPAPADSAPATYDYDVATAGVQGPTSPELANWTFRHVRTHQFTPFALVPLAELQAMLPAGYQAVATPAGSETATVGLAFMYQMRHQCRDGRVLGPASALIITTTAQNTALGRPESLNLDTVFTDPALAEAWNTGCGFGGARVGDVAVTIRETGGMLRFTFEVEDAATGLGVRAAATFSAAIPNRFLADPSPVYFRGVSGNTSLEPAFRLASQGDNAIIPATGAEVEIAADGSSVTGGTLRLAGGNLTVVGSAANVAVNRNGEFFFAPE